MKIVVDGITHCVHCMHMKTNTAEINGTKNSGFARRTFYRVVMEGVVEMQTWEGATEKAAKIVRCIAGKKNGVMKETFQLWIAEGEGFRAMTRGAKSIAQLVAFCGHSGWKINMEVAA